MPEDRSALLLVPGLMCSARLFLPQLPQLWRCAPVMIADTTRDETIAAMARRIVHHAPERFALLGLSMGGYIAMEILRQASERVTRLALLDTTARPDPVAQSARRRELIEMACTGRYREIPDLLYPSLVHPARAGDAGLRSLVRQMADECGAQGFVRQQNAIRSRPDSRPGLGQIHCPTLVLVGEADQLTPIEHARELATGIPGARLASIPDSGHLSTLEQPERVTAALMAWLAAESAP